MLNSIGKFDDSESPRAPRLKELRPNDRAPSRNFSGFRTPLQATGSDIMSPHCHRFDDNRHVLRDAGQVQSTAAGRVPYNRSIDHIDRLQLI